MNEVMEAYLEYLMEEYPILDTTSNIDITPQIKIEYNLFGDDSGKWNGIFEEYIKIFPQ